RRRLAQCYLILNRPEGSKTFRWSYVSYMGETELLDLFAELVPASVWKELGEVADKKKERPSPQIYTLPVVAWMMVYQRLNPHGTQQAAVRQLQNGGAAQLLRDCKRIREARISGATGAYAIAGSRVSVSEMEQVTDVVLANIASRAAKPSWAEQRKAYLLDGTGLSVEHEPELLPWFPPLTNQHGPAHWGSVRVVMLHDLRTGTPLRPQWGPMFGEHAVSEQKLAEAALDQVPKGSVLVTDANFGVFSTVYGAHRRALEVVTRLTQQRARALFGSQKLREGEGPMGWRPSQWDRDHHPEIPADAEVPGRWMVRFIPGFRPLYIFTTLHDSAQEVMALYLQRWNIETDLRSLKTTLRLYHLRAKSPAAVQKELLAAVIAYGLVRAFMAVAAESINVVPRRLSFTGAWVVINSAVGQLCSGSEEQRQRAMARLLHDIAEKKLPIRSKRRSYPRAIWGHRQNFPRRKPNEN
ncbi:MAG: IS4 family transposase, partial [Anaerolineales bacterium]